MENQDLRYSEAMERLQMLVEDLESGTLDLDEMLARVQEAEQLITYCRTRLQNVGGTLDALLLKMKDRP
jgi:exodeoxyribonuclease VII small subunit